MSDIPREMCGRFVRYAPECRKVEVRINARNQLTWVGTDYLRKYPNAWTLTYNRADTADLPYIPEIVTGHPRNPLNIKLYDGTREIHDGFLDLVRRVELLDHDAARYLLISPNVHFTYDLSTSFVWGHQPQGEDYWVNLARQTEPCGIFGPYRGSTSDHPHTQPSRINDYADLCLLVSRYEDPQAFRAMVTEVPRLESFMRQPDRYGPDSTLNVDTAFSWEEHILRWDFWRNVDVWFHDQTLT